MCQADSRERNGRNRMEMVHRRLRDALASGGGWYHGKLICECATLRCRRDCVNRRDKLRPPKSGFLVAINVTAEGKGGAGRRVESGMWPYGGPAAVNRYMAWTWITIAVSTSRTIHMFEEVSFGQSAYGKSTQRKLADRRRHRRR